MKQLRYLIAALALMAGIAPAIAQQFNRIPDNTFIGRLGSGTGNGPAAAVPLSAITSSINFVTLPVVTGNLACFQNTSGKLQDCGKSPTWMLSASNTWTGTNTFTGTTTINTVQVGSGAVTRTVKDKLNDTVSIADFGAVCDGTTDDTAAIQLAWNQAAIRNLNVWLGGVGPKCKISSLTMPTPVALGLGGFGPARAALLKGPGATLVTLASTVTGSTCALNITATYGVNGSLQGSFEGFGLLQNSSAGVGIGICLTGITKATFRDVAFSHFGTGLQGSDSILINVEKSWFAANVIGIGGFFGSSSNPNGWNIRDSHFDNQQQYCIVLAKPSMVNIVGNDFESNGTNSGLSPATIEILGDPVSSATMGINVVGNYFEGNAGNGEVVIDQLSLAKGGVHNVKDNTFGRTLTGQTGGIFIVNSGANTAKTIVNISGNGFLDALATGAGFQWISVATGATTNYTFVCSGNTASLSSEINSRCGNIGVSKTMSSDANAQWVGFN